MPKILIVDDQPIIRTILKDLLIKNGYPQIIEAANGVVALEVYSKEKPDLVLMDLVMPAASGMSAISNILANDPGAKIIVLSAISAEITRKNAMQLGAIGYLTKPIKDDTIVIEAVRAALKDTKKTNAP